METICPQKISLMRIVPDTSVDGPGLRTSVYCAGCRHHCPGCHNPKTWNFAAGTAVSPREIWNTILEESPDSNITFSGGDPLYQVEAFTELAKIIKSESEKNIWCYTGFTFEEIIADVRAGRPVVIVDDENRENEGDIVIAAAKATPENVNFIYYTPKRPTMQETFLPCRI